MKPHLITIAVLLLCIAAHAQSDELSVRDITQIKRICRSLIGVQTKRDDLGKADPIFGRFIPYLRPADALDKLWVVCSGACGGVLPLRGGAEVYYAFPNTPDSVPGAGHDHIDTVVLHIHGKRVLSIGPGTEYYPYPYYEQEHQKR